MVRTIVGLLTLVVAFALGAGLYVRAKLPEYREAFFYAFGPYEFVRSMQDLSEQRSSSYRRFSTEAIRRDYPEWDGGPVLNRHVHNTELADHTLRSVTTPNNDTLYTSSVLELSSTPVEVILPEVGDRYLSIALMDVFTDQFAHLGPRETEGLAGTYWILGPDDETTVPEGVSEVRASGNDVWLLARIFVAGQQDLADARMAQQGIIVRPVFPERSPKLFTEPVTELADAENFITVVNEALARHPNHPHTLRGQSYAEFGIGVDMQPDFMDRLFWSLITPRAEAAIREHIEERVTGQVGWSVPPSNLGFYEDDDLTRSVIALIGFGALRQEDAIYYMIRRSEDGELLDGNQRYTITLPAGVPYQAFWSMTLYEPDGTGRLFFFENPTGRHSLNSGSEGLQYNPDGSITLRMGSNAPDGPDSNWLPTPNGPFTAAFRLYLPEARAITEKWEPPTLTKQ